MTPSSWLYAFLKSFEQFRPTAYLPTKKDVWTIGYGHTANVKEGDCCTLSAAEEFLREDVASVAKAVSELVRATLTQNQFDALVSLTFNIGAVAFSTSTLLRELNAGNYAGASEEFLKWNKQKGVPLAGLTKRREAERAHFDGVSE